MTDSNNSIQIPTVIDSTTVFEESIFKVQRDKLRLDHKSYTYYSLKTFPFSVAILAITPEGAYVLNEEYRHPTGHLLIGCPGGFLDHGEDPIVGAKRELLEETGYEAKEFEIIGSAYPYAGISGQKIIFIRATEATKASSQKLDISEIIRSFIIMPNELIKKINSGANIDGTLCTALYLHEHVKKGEII